MKDIPVVTSRTIVALLCLILAAGCAQLQAVFKPTPPPSVPARPAPPPAPAHPARQEPPPRLSPQVSSDRETQLTQEVNAKIQGVERTLLSIDQQKLKADQSETYQTVHSFLAQAREALANKDFQQATNLAQKADVLSSELSKAVH
jgi:hypothetical protein